MLGLPGVGFHTATGFTDKYAMKRRLAAAGIDVAGHRLAQDRPHAVEAAHRLGFPVVVKPLYGGGSMGVAVCADADEVEQWWDRFAAGKHRPAALVERRADIVAEYHLDSIVLDGRVRFSVASRYLEPMLETARVRHPYASYQLPGDHPDSREVTALHERAVAALGLGSAVTHMEVFKTDDGWLASEIACRAAGGAIPEAIAMRHGPDLFDTAIGLSLGRTPDVTGPAPYDYAYFGHVALGVRPGTVTAISTEEAFAGVPGVVATDIRAKTGDTMPEAFYSATASRFSTPDGPTCPSAPPTGPPRYGS
ncbi:ATP-grasp domain-containing protein [Streptomonospora salina]|uniref:Biotin carboxylase n=1 Tax=Streptomonospora salina TaxID=104205 RepID=A0A841EBT1_9ACTN|nr:ATP-grasp domain-containing protein [Streptomonospora salina]MBB5998523.1 biotin carboxylase [Streptomonospora salina]